MTKQETLLSLETQMPSFFSLEQVIEMISNIEEPKSFALSDQLIKRIVTSTKDFVESAVRDIDFTDGDHEFSIDSSNRVVLDKVQVDTDDVVDEVGRHLKEFLQELKEELEASVEVEDNN